MIKNNSLHDPGVEDAPFVGTLLLHPVLPHSLLSTLAARNDREVQPQSLRDPCEAEDPKVVAIYDSLLIFIDYYKFLIL
jgi:hypothetical protein